MLRLTSLMLALSAVFAVARPGTAQGAGQAETGMTTAYQAALKASTGPRRSALQKAQQAWLTYRDAHCTYASIGAANAAEARSRKSSCLESLTRARTQELRESLASSGIGPGAVPPPKPTPVPTNPGRLSGPNVSGSVTYRERMALPDGAVLTVRLEDVSRQGMPAVLVAERTIPLAGRQVPIPFTLSYNAGAIKPNNDYAVRATIRANPGSGQLLFTTTRRYAVITRGNPTVVQITVERARTQ